MSSGYLFHFVTPFGLSLFITLLLVPLWITVCRKWSLFDEPDTRKHHRNNTPSMGGIAIFAGIFIAFLVFAEISDHDLFRFLFGATIILFFTGFFDDLMNVPMQNKLLMQLVAAVIAYYGGFRITNLEGLLWIHEVPEKLQPVLTILLIVTFTNAFNFIDGIDGLAGALGVIISVSLGVLFLHYERPDFAVLCFCITGALIGFLFYNTSPASIFMGDTGSLVIGLCLSLLAIEALHSGVMRPDLAVNPAMLYAILFIPLFDISRVFVVRLLRGGSPFIADRSHLHHLLLSYKLGHRSVTAILCLTAISLIVLQLVAWWMPPNAFFFFAPALLVFLTRKQVLSAYARVHHRVFRNNYSGVRDTSHS